MFFCSYFKQISATSDQNINEYNLVYVSWSDLSQEESYYQNLMPSCDSDGIDFDDTFIHYSKDLLLDDEALLATASTQREDRSGVAYFVCQY